MDYTKLLFEKYHTINLTTQQTSETTGRSIASLELDRRTGQGIRFKRLGSATNSPVRYPIAEISKWINAVEKVL